jgi:hypothetical protein
MTSRGFDNERIMARFGKVEIVHLLDLIISVQTYFL